MHLFHQKLKRIPVFLLVSLFYSLTYSQKINTIVKENTNDYQHLAVQQPTTWNVMTYINGGDGKHDPYAKYILNDTVSAIDKTDVRASIQIKKYNSDKFKKSLGSFKGSRRYIVEQAPQNKRTIKLIQDLGTDQNSGSESSLKNFIEWNYNKNPSKRQMLVMWCHGHGSNGLSHDASYQSLLNINQYASALGSRHVEIIHSNACNMQNLEAAYALRNNTDYYIASQVSTDLNRASNGQILQKVQNSPNITQEELCRYIVDTCTTTSPKSYWETRSAIKTAELKKLVEKVDHLGLVLCQAYASNQNSIAALVCESRYKAQSFRDGKDIVSLMNHLSKHRYTTIEIQDACKAVIQATQSAVFYHKNSADAKGACGLSIDFPSKTRKHDQLALYKDAPNWKAWVNQAP
jgi:hypothetical protein